MTNLLSVMEQMCRSPSPLTFIPNIRPTDFHLFTSFFSTSKKMRSRNGISMFAVPLCFICGAATTVLIVDIGNVDGTLAFEPDNPVVSVGDYVEFRFQRINHSVGSGQLTVRMSYAKSLVLHLLAHPTPPDRFFTRRLCSDLMVI
jgi:hypothetical protein